MYNEIFIVTRQVFFQSRGVHYACADNNPVVAVFDALGHAIECVELLTANNDASEKKVEVINHHSSVGLMFSYVRRDDNNLAESAYNIIHETVLP
jgi:hypothetical protein